VWDVTQLLSEAVDIAHMSWQVGALAAVVVVGLFVAPLASLAMVVLIAFAVAIDHTTTHAPLH
jgi:hypothetical protein